MRILAVDAATRCGFAIGPAGAAPKSWSERLRSGDDEPERAFKRMGIILRDLFALDRPDLVVIEAPMSMGGMVEADENSPRGFKFKSNPETIYMLTGLVAVVFGICGPYGVRARKVNVQTVRKHFLGVARPEDPKRAVLTQCHRLGWMPKDCRDDNRADACALHCYASDAWCKPATRELHLT